MDYDTAFSGFGIPLKVFLVDLLLSGDNAVLIALACRSLPPEVMRKAVFYGTIAAIVLRFVMAALVGGLLLIPGLKLIGGIMLLVIAIQLMIGDDDAEVGENADTASDDLWTAVRIIIVADVIMSIDNVVAVAAVAQGSLGYLALGLLLSVPLLIYGSIYVSGILNRHPYLITAGGALLAWTAGDLAVGDPAVSGWIDSRAFALRVAVPLAAAVFSVLHSKIIAEQRRTAPAIGHDGGSTLISGLSIAQFFDRQFRVDQDTPAPPMPVVTAPKQQDEERPETSGGNKTLVIVFLIGAPLLYLALMAYWFLAHSGL